MQKKFPLPSILVNTCKLLALFFFPLCSLYSADEPNSLSDFNQRLSALEEQSKKQTNIPQKTDSSILFFTGDFLLWKSVENGLEYVVLTDDPTQVDRKEKKTLKQPRFNYDVGFRIGAGYHLPYDSWDLFAEWTCFHTLVSSHTYSGVALFGLFTPWSSFSDVAETAFMHGQSHWDLKLDLLDVELARSYAVSKKLWIRPSLGIRTAWIKQRDDLRNDTFFGVTLWKNEIHLTNNYSAVGPKASLATTWDLFWGMNVYGSGTLSLLYGDFDIKLRENLHYTPSLHLPVKKQKLNNHLQLVRPVIDLQIGLGWDTWIIRDKLHFNIKTCWEQMIFLGQNQLLRLSSPDFPGNTMSNLGDLSFQGLSLSARIDF